MNGLKQDGIHSKERIKDEFLSNLNQPQSLEEYFIVVGVEPKISANNHLYTIPINDLNKYYKNKDFKPKILSKFPPINKSYINIDDSIIDLCFPEGYKLLQFEKMPEPIAQHFILDNSFYSIDYPIKYISCLIIYESLYNYYLLNEEMKAKLGNEYDKYYKTNDKNNIFENSEKSNGNEYKNYYFPKVLCLVSTQNFFKEQEEILKQIYQYSMDKNLKKIPIEKKILTILCNIPMPPNGLLEMEYKLSDNYKKIPIKRNRMNKISSIKEEIYLIFSKFEIDTILEIFKYLIFETKILIFGTQANELANFIYGLISLLFPFHYSFQISSTIPKKAYNIIESISPYILGINKEFDISFFKQNKIDITDLNILIIDLDRNCAKFLGDKSIPDIPSFLLKPLHEGFKKIEFKENLYEEEKYLNNFKFVRQLFFDFFVNIMTNYELYLKTDFFEHKITNTGINNLFKLDEFVESHPYNDRLFYKSFAETQMFSDFIYKKMLPKNINEKLHILFLDESISRNNNKKLFTKKRMNIFLNSADYDYKIKYEIPNSKMLAKEEKMIYSNEKERNNLIINGQLVNKEINKKTNEEEYIFEYYLFPILNESFFENPPPKEYFSMSESIHLYNIDITNNDIIKQSLINSSNNNKIITYEDEIKNYIYLSYIELWAYNYWYLDPSEKNDKFKELFKVLSKINFHDSELLDKVFESLHKFKEKNKIIILYDFLLKNNINPSSYIYNTFNSYISKNINKSSSSSNLLDNNDKNDSKNGSKNVKYHKKTFHSCKDGKCLGDKIIFYPKQKCPECGQEINITEICLNYKNMRKDFFWTKCPKCEKYIIPKLGVSLGNEITNIKETKENPHYNFKSSNYTKFILHSPYEVKVNLKKIKRQNRFKMFHAEFFKQEYPSLFWSCIWYFKLYKISYDIFLPYEWNISQTLFNHEEYIPTNIESNINIRNSINEIDINSNKNIRKKKKIKKRKYLNDNLVINSAISLSFLISDEKSKRYSSEFNSFCLNRKSTKASSNKSSFHSSELVFRISNASNNTSHQIPPKNLNKFNSCLNFPSRARLNTLTSSYLFSSPQKSRQLIDYSSANNLISIKEKEECIISPFSKSEKEDEDEDEDEFFLENLYSKKEVNNSIISSFENKNCKLNTEFCTERKKSFAKSNIFDNKNNSRNKSVKNSKIKYEID